MLQDWMEASKGVVKLEHGSLIPIVYFKDWGDSIMYAADSDGLIATIIVKSANGSRSMLTALFKMKYKEAVKVCKSKQFPLKINQPFKVVAMIDCVTGDGGETYSRMKIIPC